MFSPSQNARTGASHLPFANIEKGAGEGSCASVRLPSMLYCKALRPLPGNIKNPIENLSIGLLPFLAWFVVPQKL